MGYLENTTRFRTGQKVLVLPDPEEPWQKGFPALVMSIRAAIGGDIDYECVWDLQSGPVTGILKENQLKEI